MNKSVKSNRAAGSKNTKPAMSEAFDLVLQNLEDAMLEDFKNPVFCPRLSSTPDKFFVTPSLRDQLRSNQKTATFKVLTEVRLALRDKAENPATEKVVSGVSHVFEDNLMRAALQSLLFKGHVLRVPPRKGYISLYQLSEAKEEARQASPEEQALYQVQNQLRPILSRGVGEFFRSHTLMVEVEGSKISVDLHLLGDYGGPFIGMENGWFVWGSQSDAPCAFHVEATTKDSTTGENTLEELACLVLESKLLKDMVARQVKEFFKNMPKPKKVKKT